jgi:excisionase family DNA binding protein
MPLEIAGLKLYDMPELAQTLGITMTTVRNYIQQGRLKAVKVGRYYRVEENDLREFLLSGRLRAKHKRNNLNDYQQRMERALALAEELDPIIEVGTMGRVDATEDIHAIRQQGE